MKKKILGLAILGLSLTALTACGNENTITPPQDNTGDTSNSENSNSNSTAGNISDDTENRENNNDSTNNESQEDNNGNLDGDLYDGPDIKVNINSDHFTPKTGDGYTHVTDGTEIMTLFKLVDSKSRAKIDECKSFRQESKTVQEYNGVNHTGIYIYEQDIETHNRTFRVDSRVKCNSKEEMLELAKSYYGEDWQTNFEADTGTTFEDFYANYLKNNPEYIAKYYATISNVNDGKCVFTSLVSLKDFKLNSNTRHEETFEDTSNILSKQVYKDAVYTETGISQSYIYKATRNTLNSYILSATSVGEDWELDYSIEEGYYCFTCNSDYESLTIIYENDLYVYSKIVRYGATPFVTEKLNSYFDTNQIETVDTTDYFESTASRKANFIYNSEFLLLDMECILYAEGFDFDKRFNLNGPFDRPNVWIPVNSD